MESVFDTLMHGTYSWVKLLRITK